MTTEPVKTPSRKRRRSVLSRAKAFFSKLSLLNKLALLFIVLAIPLGYGSLLLLKPVYRVWKANNALRIAEISIGNGDVKAASLAFRTAIRSRPKDPKIWRSVATFLDEIESPESFSVWSQAVQLDPSDVDAQFSLLEAGIRLGRIEKAQQTLSELPASVRDSVRFHRAAASVALAGNDRDEAEKQLLALLEQDPDSAQARWDLIRVRAVSPDLAVRTEAQSDMQTLAEGDGEFATEARRQLVRFALASQDFYTANRTAEKLVESPDVAAEDWVLFLDTEFASQSFTLPGSISGILDFAETTPAATPAVVNYLAARGMSDRLTTWFESLPEDVSKQAPVQSAWFDLALKGGDWAKAFAILRGEQSPHPFSAELTDVSETALGDFRRGASGALPEWKRAIFLAESNPAAAYVLARLADTAGWREGYSLALWALASSMGNRPEIWSEVLKVELASRNSTGILRALAGAVRADPDNRRLRNDWILMNLLLEQGDLEELLKLARDNADFDPANSFYVTTYGLALALSDESSAAVEVISRIPEAEQRQPEKALYVGAILASDGQTEAAKPFLEQAAAATSKFLPEERAMYDRSKAIASGEISREEELERITARNEMSPEEAAEFTATLRSQGVAADGGSDAVTETLRQTAADERRSPDEIREILQNIRSSAPAQGEESAAE